MLGDEVESIALRVGKERLGVEHPGFGGKALLFGIVKG